MADNICRQATLVSVEEARELVAELRRTEAFMPFFDPTAYLAVSNTLPGHLAAAEAFLAFREALERLRA